jgi:hypothetical protein
VKASNVQELIKEARARTGGMTYGSFGNGNATHLASEMFKAATDVNLAHVPYKGSAPALADLLGGQIDMMFDVLVTGLPHVQAGKLRALAVTGPKRSALLPSVPTMQEAGIKDYEAATWFAPAGTSREVVERLSKALDRILAKPEFQKALATTLSPRAARHSTSPPISAASSRNGARPPSSLKSSRNEPKLGRPPDCDRDRPFQDMRHGRRTSAALPRFPTVSRSPARARRSRSGTRCRLTNRSCTPWPQALR